MMFICCRQVTVELLLSNWIEMMNGWRDETQETCNSRDNFLCRTLAKVLHHQCRVNVRSHRFKGELGTVPVVAYTGVDTRSGWNWAPSVGDLQHEQLNIMVIYEVLTQKYLHEKKLKGGSVVVACSLIVERGKIDPRKLYSEKESR